MYYLAIDQGTTGSTAMLVNSKTFKIITKKNQECLGESKIDPKLIKGIGITNQRETICAFDRKGNPLENAIVWQDRRTGDFCQRLKDQNLESKIKSITGLTIDPYFSGTKINWLINF